jgi:hypothetical protein
MRVEGRTTGLFGGVVGASVVALALCGGLGCSRGSHEKSDGTAACDAPAGPNVTWKRQRVLAQDLKNALALGDDELCTELGTSRCVDVHRVALGASDPFGHGLYAAFDEPLSTTPIATERLVLAACSRRAELDAASGAPVVFKGVDLGAGSAMWAAAKGGGADGAGARALVADLVTRFYGRDATDDEIGIVLELAARAESGKEFAKLACFAIGTSNEFLFF